VMNPGDVCGWHEQSLWCRWARYCESQAPCSTEVRSVVGGVPVGRNLVTPGALDRIDADRLLRLLQLEKGEVCKATGEDLAARDEVGSILCAHLRYCPTCLQGRFHSMLHQHLGIDRCPVHGALLLAGCKRCGAKLPKTVAEVAAAPLSCGSCGEMLSRASRLSPETVAADWNRLALARAAKGGPPSGGFRAHWPGTGPEQSNSPAVHRRQVSRWTDWAPVAAADHRYPGQSSMLFNRYDGVAPVGDSVRLLAKHLMEIHEMLPGHHEAIARLSAAVGEASGARIHGASSVAAAAFYKTCQAYRIRLDESGFPDTRSALEITYAIGRPGFRLGLHPHAWDEIAGAEVRALFAILLLETSRLRGLDEVAWNRAPSPITYCPAWRWTEVEPGTCELRMRPRVDRRGLRWLIARLGGALLQAPQGSRLRESLQWAQHNGIALAGQRSALAL
jgi:hypothetical protein